MPVRLLILLSVCVQLIACATQPISNRAADNVPSKRIIDQSYLSQDTDELAVTIKRDQGINGAACATRIYIDGNGIADIRAAEKLVIYLKPGKYLASAETLGVCASGVDETNIQVKEDSANQFRISLADASIRIQPTAF